MDRKIRIVYKRRERNLNVCRKCWSLRRRCYKGLPILPSIRDQGQNATCLKHALCSIMEAKLRMNGISVTLSADCLESSAQALYSSQPESNTRTVFSDVELVLLTLKTRGVRSDEDFKKGYKNGTWYRIKGYKRLNWMKFMTPTVVEELKKNGPLLAIIYVSNNYTSDILSKWIYSFDSANPTKVNGQTKTHAVMVTGFGIDALLSFWEMMNSHGKLGKQKGFGCFDFGSLIGLYSINM